MKPSFQTSIGQRAWLGLFRGLASAWRDAVITKSFACHSDPGGLFRWLAGATGGGTTVSYDYNP
jgi:hypothetical protein